MEVEITGDPVKVVVEFPNGNKYTSMSRTAFIHGSSVLVVGSVTNAALPGAGVNGTSDWPRAVHGMAFLDVLAEAGIIDGHTVRRVVIDVPFDDAVRVYVERVGDERLLNMATTLEGIEITRGE